MRTKTLVVALVITMGIASMAFAQSSGNFTYGTGVDSAGNPITTACVLNSKGVISGGQQCKENCTLNSDGTSTCTTLSNTDCIGNAIAGIKTNSGNGNVFVIRPSAVIGLLTDVTVSSKQIDPITGSSSSSALAGIDFQVTVAPASGQAKPTVIPAGWITYDARYVQISTNLFTALTSACTGTDAATLGCYITFNESTVSAHSFDFITTGLSSGEYDVTASWRPDPAFTATGISEALACVGPVNMTVQQNKIFHFNSVNQF